MEIRCAVVSVSQLGFGGELELFYRDTSVCVSNQYGRRDVDEHTRTSRTDTGFECRLNINLLSRGQRPSKVLIRTRSQWAARWKGRNGQIVLRQSSFVTG